VDVAFAGFFLAKWLGKQSYLDDLVTLDPELYKGLVYLKDVEGPIDHLALNFAIAHDGDLCLLLLIVLLLNHIVQNMA
jgi:ubiquitin-protein ligase E3 C